MRYKILFVIMSISFLIFASTLFAKIVLPPIDGPIVKKISIFVPELSGSGADSKAREFVQVLRNDLINAGLFDVSDGRGVSLNGTGSVNFQSLFDAGAEALVRGDYSSSGGTIKIGARLFDVIGEQEILGRSYEAGSERVREAAHKFASLVIKELTGIDGFFTSKIVYVSGGAQSRDLYSMDYDGHNSRKLTNHRSLLLSPHCSLDGTKIVFNSDKVWDQDIYVLNLTPKISERRLTRGFKLEQSAEWSPNGSRMAYSVNGDIFVANADGTGTVNLTRHSSIDVSPTWSPDGSRIAFTSDRSGTPQIYVMSAGGGNLRRVTSGVYSTDPSWSPNPEVNKIAFVRVQRAEANIFAINPDGSGEKRLTGGSRKNENPAWSPDGHYIAYTSTKTGAKDVYIMYLSGENQRQLTKGGGKSFPTWCR